MKSIRFLTFSILSKTHSLQPGPLYVLAVTLLEVIDISTPWYILFRGCFVWKMSCIF